MAEWSEWAQRVPSLRDLLDEIVSSQEVAGSPHSVIFFLKVVSLHTILNIAADLRLKMYGGLLYSNPR